MDYVLVTQGLSKRYKDFKALDSLTMHVPKGSIYGFVGRNGAGKTTLIRLICGLQSPTGGSYALYGVDSAQKDIAKVRRRIGAVVETPAIYLDLTARDNLREQYRVLGLPDESGIGALLELVGLEKKAYSYPDELSGGEQQMLAIGRALMSSPKLLMLDEPSMGLAPILVEQIFDIIKELHAAGTTILLVEQNAQAALSVADRAYVLETGRVSLSGTGAELMASDQVRRAYLGG